MKKYQKSLFLFRRDLRLDDNTDLIEYSLGVDIDIDINNRSFPDEVWDHDWS